MLTTSARTCLALGLLMALISASAIYARAQTFTLLHSFSGADGTNTRADLIQASDGGLYGVCQNGGANGNGTIYKITTSGTFTTLYSFTGGSDGAQPYAALLQASDGNLYGTCEAGGANGNGTIYKITLSGTFTALHSFNGTTEGKSPWGGLIQASDGNLYGLGSSGGTNNAGTIFKITTSGTFTTLHTFNGSTDGGGPNYMIQASDGNLYGTAGGGGAYGNGVVFKSTLSGAFTTLHSFAGSTEGAGPSAGVIQARDGNLYGTCIADGVNGEGTLFMITLSGTFTLLHSFNGTDGAQPWAGLVLAGGGNLYGTAYNGGANANGTIYKITTSGTFTTLYNFSSSGNTDGAHPYEGLVQASDGNLYGTCSVGGANGKGTIYSLDVGLGVHVPSDFNGDGIPDLLFQNASTGQLAVWYMNGTTATPIGGAFVTPSQSSGWKAVGDADFNADGHPDILFQNSSTGQLALWIMNGVTATGGQLLSSTPPSGWNVVSLADFNGDGSPDLLLQNSSNRQLAIWYMNGSTITGGAYVSAVPASGWIAVGSGDFNADGKSDIVLQNYSTGQLAVWYMNNSTATGGTYITPSQQAGWKCVSVIDLNGDGKPDLVFQNTTSGQLVYWLMNGVKATGGNSFSQQPQSGWLVVGPH